VWNFALREKLPIKTILCDSDSRLS